MIADENVRREINCLVYLIVVFAISMTLRFESSKINLRNVYNVDVNLKFPI